MSSNFESCAADPTSGDKHWSNVREAGSLTGLRFLWFIHRVFGRRAVSWLLRPVILYFLLFRSEERRVARDYLQTHAHFCPDQWPHKPGFKALYRLFREFAESIVDKLLAWHLEIDPDSFHLKNPEATEQLLNDSRGQVIIGSHIGNIEYCRGYMHRYETKVINILVHERHAGNYVAMMKILNPESRINVFQVDEFDIPTMLLLKEKVDAGEWVFIAGDRVPLSGNERTVTVSFLGRETQLPIGPYLLAHALNCPVRLMFSYKNYCGEDNRLHFEVVHLADQISLPRRQREQQLKHYAQTYADHLQRVTRDAPFQWFNFYDYWQPAKTTDHD